MKWLALALALTLTACPSAPTYPPVPPPPPPPIVDPPLPPPPLPPVDPTFGTITEAGYASVVDGETEAAVVARLGVPFRSSEAAGFRILAYAFAASSHTAYVWLKAGVVSHKSRV